MREAKKGAKVAAKGVRKAPTSKAVARKSAIVRQAAFDRPTRKPEAMKTGASKVKKPAVGSKPAKKSPRTYDGDIPEALKLFLKTYSEL